LVDLLELKGVRVFSLPEEVRDIDAFSFWRGDVPYIFLNTSKSSEHSRMDAGHELGHLVLHSSHGVPRGREEEREAQHFGAAFLMPRGSVIAGAPRSANVRDLIIAKHRWGVAVASLVYRMHQLGLLTDWQYRSLFIEMSASGYRQDEPSPIAHEASQVLAKVFSMLRGWTATAGHRSSAQHPRAGTQQARVRTRYDGHGGQGPRGQDRPALFWKS